MDHQAYQTMFDGARPKTRRPVTDYASTLIQWARNRRPNYMGRMPIERERPSPNYIVDFLPPAARLDRAVDSIPARHLHSSLNKIKHPVNVVVWTPEGRRLLTASSSGEFTLWNGMGFNFETIMQAHDSRIRAAVFSHSDDWLLSADQEGIVKYWLPNFNNVNTIQAHADAIQGAAFAPTDAKFVTCSDDGTLKIFDFAGGIEESSLTGHQWELRSVDWHPNKGLIASASKDHTVKLWDPRTSRCLTTLSGHKNHVLSAIFEPQDGQMLASGGKDHIIRIFDLRMMRDVFQLRGHDKDVNTLAWHPIHKNLLSSAGADGAIIHHLLDEQNVPAGISASLSPYDSNDPDNATSQTIYPAHAIPFAHDFQIWSLAWHPLGHVMASGSNDRVTRFWSRPRPGDTSFFKDRYHIGQAAAEAQGTYDRRDMRRQQREEEEMEAEDEADGLVDQAMPSKPALPGLPGLGGMAAPSLPGIGNAPPIRHPHQPMPPLPPGLIPGQPIPDFSKLAEMFGGQVPLPFPPLANGQFPPIPLPGFPPPPFPGFNLQGPPPPGFPPPPFQGFPQGFPPVPLPIPIPIPQQQQQQQQVDPPSGDTTVRKRGPLPSQQESLLAEQRQGRYTRPT